MQFIDAHHHLWDLSANYYPWLVDRITPRFYGDYTAIRKNYLLADFVRDIADQPVVKSVHVQAESDHRDPVRETRWLQGVADCADNNNGFPNAIVAYADLSADDAASVLEQHCRFPNVRGIRQSLNGIITAPAHSRDILNDSNWRRNLSLLERFGLSYDLQLYPSQMPSMAELVRRHERVQFIVCHAGLPADRTTAGIEEWRHGMKLLADLPNCAVKISGLGMFDKQWSSDSIRPIVLDTIAMFGPPRTMFASNFPVDGLMGSYARIWDLFLEVTKEFSDFDRRSLFHDSAARLYRI